MKEPSPLFLLPVLVGPVLIAVGWLLHRHPPKTPNVWYGYRTKAARQSQRHWDHAQRLAGRLLMYSGVIYTPLFTLDGAFEWSEMQESLIAIGLLILLFVAIVVRLERSLRNL